MSVYGTPCMLKGYILPRHESFALFYLINDKLALLLCEMKERLSNVIDNI
jgi:hypothetical protein